MLRQVLLDDFRIGARLIHLVDGDDDRHAGSLRMADGLDGLRLDAVVSCNDQYSDVRGVRASGSHGCKRFVSRCIQEYDLLSVDLDLGSTDVLGDTAGLACCNVCISDGVEQ